MAITAKEINDAIIFGKYSSMQLAHHLATKENIGEEGCACEAIPLILLNKYVAMLSSYRIPRTDLDASNFLLFFDIGDKPVKNLLNDPQVTVKVNGNTVGQIIYTGDILVNDFVKFAADAFNSQLHIPTETVTAWAKDNGLWIAENAGGAGAKAGLSVTFTSVGVGVKLLKTVMTVGLRTILSEVNCLTEEQVKNVIEKIKTIAGCYEYTDSPEVVEIDPPINLTKATL